MCGIKLSLHTRNGSMWRFFCMQGEFCTALLSTTPSRESFVPNARQRSSEPRQYSGATGAKRKAPKEPQDLAAVQAAAGWQGQHRFAGASARLISHIISHGHFSRPPKNVAIPTMQIQYLNKLQGNYVRNCSDGSKACSARIRMQFDWTNLQQTQKTLQFQRCKFNV